MAFEALNNAGTLAPTCWSSSTTTRCRSASPWAPSISTLPRCCRARLYNTRAPRWQGSAVEAAAGEGAREALGGAHEGDGASRHAVRGVRLQLHRADRRPRRRRAGGDAFERARAQGPAVPARHHAEGLRLRACRGRSDPLPRRDEIRPRHRHRRQGVSPQAHVHAGLRRLAVRHGRERPASRGDHARHARRLGPGALLAGVPEPLLRRRHRRAARGDVRRRPRVRRHAARRGDLFDVPPTRVRPADPRRRIAEPSGDVRHRPRRHRGRRRRDAPRRVRPLVPALPAQHDGDGAGRTRTSAGRR